MSKYPRTSFYANEANKARIKELFGEGSFSDFCNKCCSYVLQQDEAWIREFVKRQPLSFTSQPQ